MLHSLYYLYVCVFFDDIFRLFRVQRSTKVYKKKKESLYKTNHMPDTSGGGYALKMTLNVNPCTRARAAGTCRLPPAPLSMARGIEQVGLEGLGFDRMEALLVEALRGGRNLDDGVQRDGDIDALLAPQPREVGIQHSQDGLVAGQ